jgi:hypothetical protein
MEIDTDDQNISINRVYLVYCKQFPRKRQFWRGGGATNAAAIVDTIHELSFFIKYLDRSPRYRQLDVNYTMHIDDDVKFLTLLILAEKERMKVSKEKKRIASDNAEAERVALRAADFEKKRLQLEQESAVDMATNCALRAEQCEGITSRSDVMIETRTENLKSKSNTCTNTNTDPDADLASNVYQMVDEMDPGSSSSSILSTQGSSALSRYFGSFVSLVGERLGILPRVQSDTKQITPSLTSISSSGGGSSSSCVSGRREAISSGSDSYSPIVEAVSNGNTSCSSNSGNSDSNSNHNDNNNNGNNSSNSNSINDNSKNSQSSNNNHDSGDATGRNDLGNTPDSSTIRLTSPPLFIAPARMEADAQQQIQVQQLVQQQRKGEEDETLPPFSVSRAGLYSSSIPYNIEENFMPIWINELPCTLKGTYNILRPKSLIEKERELSEMRLRALARQKAAFGIAACYHPFLASLINGTESAWDSEVDADDDAGSGDY